MNYKHLAFLPIPGLLILIFILKFIFGSTVSYDPPWLILTLNAVFVTAVCLTVSVISMRNYMSTGRLQVLLLGCGVLVLAIGGTASAYAIGLSNGVNLAVTIHNTGTFAAALFHFVSAIVLISAFSGFRPKQKRLWLFSGYSGVIIFMVLLTLAGLKGLTPPFFIQGEGPTMLRQFVLGSAAVLFAFSFLIFIMTYQKNREVFLYWYSLALGLNSICFIAVFIQNSVGSPVGWVGRISQYTGGIYFLIAIISAVRSAGARKTSFDNVVTSSLRLAEEALRESEEKYRLIFETSNEGIWVTDGDRRTILVNKRMADMLGYTSDELHGRIPAEFLQPGQEPQVLKARHNLTGGATTHYEFRFRRKDGSDLWVISSAAPVMDSEGSLLRTVSMLTDITERKQAEEQAAKTYSRLKTFFDVRIGGIGIVIARADGSVLQANDYYLDILGYTRQEFGAGKVKWIESTPQEWLPADERALAQLRDRGACDPYEKEYIRRDGTRVPVLITDVMMPGPENDILAIVVNMTERKRAEEALRESEAKIRAVFQSLAEGVVFLDTDGKVQEANDAAQIAHSIEELQSPEVDPRFRIIRPDGTLFPVEEQPAIVAINTGQAVRNVEMGLPMSDGTTIWRLVNAQPVYDDTGVLLGAVASFFDITERKQAEETFAKTFQSAAASIALTQIEDGRILDVNNRWLELMGYRREEIIGKTTAEYGGWTDPRDRAAMVRELKAHGLVRDMECVIRTKSGREMTVLFSAQAIAILGKEVLVSSAIDITERKQAEEALRESEERLSLAQAAAGSGVWDWNIQADTLQWSDEFFRLFGLDCRQDTSSFDIWRSMLHPDDRCIAEQNITDAIEQRVALDNEYRIVLRSGEVRWINALGNTIYDEAGKPLRMSGICINITARKKAEEELHILNKTLEDRVAERTAEAERRALQLRQLAAELTLAEQRERQRISLVLHDGLQQILVAAKFKMALFGKISDIAGLTRDLAELIDDGIETSRSLTAELSPPILQQGGLVPALEWLSRWMQDKHGLAVRLVSQSEIQHAPEEVLILLFQSIRELLFNAAKHAGVRTARVEVSQENGRIIVDVVDEGAGFDPGQLNGKGGKSGGLGLFSIQERLSYLGGSMEIDSAPGHGSRFRLITPPISMKPAVSPAGRQPIVSVAMVSKQDATAGPEKRVRIILVDDHMVMRQGLASLLRTEPDLEIIGEASDGQSAIELIRELRPDVVLMDINMPGIDGIQATRIIHKELPEVSIIGLSMF
ncbi:MAG: PAS domain S-box protein [Spirochaetota bacterium]